MSTPLPFALAAVPGLDELANAAYTLHAEHARLLEQTATAEDSFIRAIADAHRGGRLDWVGLAAAYDLVRSWSKTNGIGSFIARWEAHIAYDSNTIARYTKAMPNNPDGKTWTGDTGYSGMARVTQPVRGMAVAFVLFGNGGVPVHIGYTESFRGRMKALDREGVAWESWLAQLCDGRQDALEARRQLVARFGEPNEAARPNNSASPAEVRGRPTAVDGAAAGPSS